jgi:hypothetical protein
MYMDSDGDCPRLIWLIVAAYVAWAVQDVYDIIAEEVTFIEDDHGNGGQIENSYKVQNPSVVVGYSIYLRYFSKHKDCFDGSAGGIADEWLVHNIAYDLTWLPSQFGIWEKANDSAKHVDVGRTVFDDQRWYVVASSRLVESLTNPIAYYYDYFLYLSQNVGDGNE